MHYQNLRILNTLDSTVALLFLVMREIGAYSLTYHSPDASVRGWTDRLKWDSPGRPHDSQVREVVSTQAAMAHVN